MLGHDSTCLSIRVCVHLCVQRCVGGGIDPTQVQLGFCVSPPRVRSCARPYVIRTPTRSGLPLYQRLAGDVSCQPVCWLAICLLACLSARLLAPLPAWILAVLARQPDPSDRRPPRCSSREPFSLHANCSSYGRLWKVFA